MYFKHLFRLRKLIAALVRVSLVIIAMGAGQAATAAIAYIQGNSAVPQTAQATVSATYTAAQAAGDLNVVVVGWSDSTAKIQSVTDTRGNVYKLAVGPTVNVGNATQAIYYTVNSTASAASSNKVTATFNTPAKYVDLRIAEYRGVSAVDVVTAKSGSGLTASTNTVATAGSSDLLLAANTVSTGTAGAGSGYTKRLITSPDSDLLEDRIVTAAGSYSATAPLLSSGAWVMQMVAFKAGSSGGSSTTNTPPTISGTPATSVAVGSPYLFLPKAADANGNPLTFSVSNKPVWATFSTSTGQLSGTPPAADVGNYPSIVISVSDGKATASLPAFTIAVTQVATGTATVHWTPPTQNTNGSSLSSLAGYKIYYGTNAGTLNQVIQLANPGLASYVLTNLSSATYYFAVTAYSSSGTESAKSSVVSKVVP